MLVLDFSADTKQEQSLCFQSDFVSVVEKCGAGVTAE